MSDLFRAAPNVDDLLGLPTEQVARLLLKTIQAAAANPGTQVATSGFQPASIVEGQLGDGVGRPGYPQGDRVKTRQVRVAIMEGMEWLRAQHLIVPSPSPANYGNGHMVLSRRGEGTMTEEDWDEIVSDRLYPPGLLHKTIIDEAWTSFRSPKLTDRSKAVRDAFLAVEVAVKAASGLGPSLIGVELMKAAFAPKGKLADPRLESGEHHGRQNLFAGAMGSFRNPASHSYPALTGRQAYEQIMLASQLMHILDDVRSELGLA